MSQLNRSLRSPAQIVSERRWEKPDWSHLKGLNRPQAMEKCRKGKMQAAATEIRKIRTQLTRLTRLARPTRLTRTWLAPELFQEAMCHFHQLFDYNIKRSCQNNQNHGPSRKLSWQKDQSSRANWAPKPSLTDTSCIRTKPSTVQSPLGLLSVLQDKGTALNNPCWTSRTSRANNTCLRLCLGACIALEECWTGLEGLWSFNLCTYMNLGY